MSVLAAVLPGDASYAAVLRAAGALAGAAPFSVVSVFPLPSPEQEVVPLRSQVARTAEARAAVRRRIEADLEARSLRATVDVPLASLRSLGDDIVERARAADVDVIVIGTRGRTGLSRLLLGSVAERVVRRAHCDVYVAREPRGD